MPLYSDSNYYYAGGSSQLFAPYYPSGVYSLPTVSSAYAPYTSNYNRSVGSYMVPVPTSRSTPSTYTSHCLGSRYQPKLSTIGETSPLITSSRHVGLLPLTRIHSPKISTYSSTSSHTLHSKYIPARPININTADIDVSSARYRRQREEEREEKRRQEKDKVISEEDQCPVTDSNENSAKTDAAAIQNAEMPEQNTRCSTIKRNRTIVRLSTVRTRSKTLVDSESKQRNTNSVEQAPEEVMGWRQKLAEDLTLLPPSQTKKSPGQLLRERFLIQDTKVDDAKIEISRSKSPVPEPEVVQEVQVEEKLENNIMDEMLVEVDPATHICHVSIPSGPTFHDICEDISSDRIDDDLNAGALRKRASIIQEREQELLNQLQKSASGSFQMIHLERRASRDSTSEEPQPTNTGKKKIKHKITAIVDVQNAPLIPILQELDEDQLSPQTKMSPKPKITYNVEAVEEHHEINKVFKLPKKKIEKSTRQSSSRVSKKRPSISAQVFTFDEASVQKQHEAEELKVFKTNKNEKNISAIGQKVLKTDGNATKTKLQPSSSAECMNKPKTIPIKTSKSLESTVTMSTDLKTEKTKPKQNIEPQITTIAKSESIDFWATIGNRESVYMEKRKHNLPTRNLDSSPELVPINKDLQKASISSDIRQVTNKKNTITKTSLPKVENLLEPLKLITEEVEKENTPVQAKDATESLVKITANSQQAKSAEPPDNRKITSTINKALTVEKTPTLTKTTTTTSIATTVIKNAIAPIIQAGQKAKSPEHNANNNIVKIATSTTVITIATTTTTTTTTTSTSTTMKSVAAVRTLNEKMNNSSQEQKTINNVILKKDAKKIGTQLATTTTIMPTKTITTTATTTSSTSTAQKVPAITKKIKTTTGTGTKVNEMEVISDAPKQQISADNKKTINDKVPTKTTATASIEKNNVVMNDNKAKTSPINADGFITIAPAKSTFSPTNAKNKNASPIIRKDNTAMANKLTDKVKITTSNTGDVKLNALAIITPTLPLTTPSSNLKTKTTDTIIATTPIKTIRASNTTNKQEQEMKNKNAETGGQNNLSKFATVVDLAQCLRDVDADLEDYIPSSAENSDNDDLTDDSTLYCSSVDGCENLSASMKKKLKQKKRKEKQAQVARFDPHKKIKIDTANKCYVVDEAPRHPLVATPRPLWKREKFVFPEESSEESSDSEESSGSTADDTEESYTTSEEEEYQNSGKSSPALTGTTPSGSSIASKDDSIIIRLSTCSNDSGFEGGGTAPSSPKKMLGKTC